jgi:hypothetical protein
MAAVTTTMDDAQVFGLGALDSPDDPRDWPAARLMALADAPEADAAPPESWLAPDPQAPTYLQGSSPMCVSYGTGGDKVYDDLRDTGLFAPDFPLFFSQIGGTQYGAVPRTALQRLVDAGYPVDGRPELAARHRIASYARVEPDRASLCEAMPVLGPLLLSLRWHYSWFRPVAGVLPAPSGAIGGHLVRCVGWTAAGLVCVNSWGTAWGDHGRFTIPWAYLSEVKEAWATSDLVEPPALKWSLRVAARASVRHSSRNAAGLYVMPDRLRVWGPKASSAACWAPKRIRTTKGQTITAVAVTSGVFAGRTVHLGPGVTATAKEA